MNSFIDYYEVLGIGVDASTSDVKAAFKKRALQYHPDVYKGEDAHERMRVLLLAYQTLSDPEARQQYDAHRSEHTFAEHNSSSMNSKTTGSVQSRNRAMRGGVSEVSPAARRDRQRHYAFPNIRPGLPVTINLTDISYELSADEARTLQQQGMIRGTAPKALDRAYYCHRCKHHWHVAIEKDDAPRFCPKCQASDWTEYLLLRCTHCCAVFESEQIRYEIGPYSYGKAVRATATPALCPPYELFPLCPYCGTAHWCPAEDARVEDLRLRLAKHAATMRMVWISVTIFAIVILGVIALGVMH